MQDIIRASFQIIQVSRPCSWTQEYSNKTYENRNNLVTKNLLLRHKAVFLTQIVLKNNDMKAPNPLYNLIFLMSFSCQSYVLVYHSYVTRMSSVCHSYVVRISLVCVRMSSVCHSHVLVCHPYVTRMYSYVIRMSLICNRMSSVCHSYVLICHPYLTRIYLYIIRMLLVCDFTMNPSKVVYS